MQIASLGHVVVRVSDLDRSQQFHHDVLGLPISQRSEDWAMVSFTLGQHHDFAITVTPDPGGNGVELNVDGSEAWRADPSLILSDGGPLEW